MSDRIAFPADWISASVKDIVDPSRAITYGIVQPGPRFDPDRGTPMIRGQDYSSGTVRTDDLYYVDPRLAAGFSRASVQGGDLLVSIVGYVGTVAEVPGELAGANLTQTTARVSVREHLKGRYFLHFLRSRCFKDEVRRFTKGSAQPGLNLADVEVMRVAYPQDASERAAIAEVLDTLDTTIRQTEAIIEKLKQVKQGLLHDLLTRGIDANGELRPPQSQAPHLYKDSPLGWIPREWQLRRFRDIGRAPQLGLMVRGASPDGTNIGLLKMGNLLAGNQLDLGYVEQLNVRKIDRLDDYVLADGDLLFNTRNTPELVGKTCSWRGRFGTTVFDNNILRMRMAAYVGNGHFIASYMGAAAGRARLLGLATGTTSVAAIYWKDLQHFVLPLPESQEQDLIVERLDACDWRMDQEKAVAGALAALKPGLMNDLLTGRVRVSPLLA